MTVSTNEKNAKLGQKGQCGLTWPNFQILRPPNILGTVEARNFKFGTEIDGNAYFKKMLK